MTDPGWYAAEGDPPGTTRYWDGAQWIGEPVAAPAAPAASPAAYGAVGAPGVQSFAGAPATAAVARTSDGKLIAAGVLSIISGAVVAIGSVWLLAVANSDSLGFIDDLTGGAFTVIGFIGLLIAALYLTAGIGSVQGKNWGRVTNIVVQGLALALFVIGFIGALADSGNDALGSLIPIIWSGTILGLAIVGKPWR